MNITGQKLSLDLLRQTKQLLKDYKPLPIGPLLCPPNVPPELQRIVEKYNEQIETISDQLFAYGCVSYYIDGINLIVHAPKDTALFAGVQLSSETEQ